MRKLLRARSARGMAMLFGLAMLLTACDVADLNQLLADVMGTQPVPADQVAEEADDAAEDAADAAGEGSEEASDDAGDEAGGDDTADAARERCLNRNEHLANLRTPERVDDGRRERRRQRQRAGAEESDDAPGGGAATDGAEDEAPAEPATPSESRRNTGNGGGGNGGGGNGGGQGAGGGDTAGLSNIERQVFDLLMEERAAAGLEPLQLDSGLSEGARAWSRRMATENFFSHDSGNFAENIAYGYPTAAAVHDGWMGSDGHRRNRMNAGYSTYGVGVFEQGGTIYYTERFS